MMKWFRSASVIWLWAALLWLMVCYHVMHINLPYTTKKKQEIGKQLMKEFQSKFKEEMQKSFKR